MTTRRDIAAHVALNLLLATAVTLALAVAVVPRVSGSVPLTVLTGSMSPAYAPGDLIVVRPVAADDLAVGDVITFQPVADNPALVTHRVANLTREDGQVVQVTTQGDANGSADRPLVPAQVMGRVWYRVPLVGRLMTGTGPVWAVAAAGLALVGYGVWAFLKPADGGQPAVSNGLLEVLS